MRLMNLHDIKIMSRWGYGLYKNDKYGFLDVFAKLHIYNPHQ